MDAAAAGSMVLEGDQSDSLEGASISTKFSSVLVSFVLFLGFDNLVLSAYAHAIEIYLGSILNKL